MSTSIALNARFKVHRPTGMQRYAIELANRFGNRLRHIQPGGWAVGAKGHLWEQSYLPIAARGSLLWSPVSTGPVAFERQVCTIHDLIPLDRPEWYEKRFAQFYNWIIPRLAKTSRHVIAVSSYTKKRLIERCGIRPESISVVLNGVDSTFYPRRPDEIESVRRALGIALPRYVLYVGSVEPRKNLNRLIEAWIAIRKRIPDDICLVVSGLKGSASVFSEVRFAEIPKNVLFTGYVAQEQLPVLYSGATAFVYPALYEGFGLPPLEAMACGTPVLTSNNTSIPEVMGQSGVLVDPFSVEEIAQGMVRLITNAPLREELIQRGLARAAELTWDETAKRTWEILAREAAA